MAQSVNVDSVTNGLVCYIDSDNLKSFAGGPVSNILPNGTNAGYPTSPSGWGTYNVNQYNNNTYFSIGTISSIVSNIVTTSGNHPLRTYDVVTPQTTGGGVTAGTNYLVRKLTATTFSLHTYINTQDSVNIFDSHSNLNNDTRVSINSTNFPTMWWGPPHLPNSGIMKQTIRNGFSHNGRVHDCMRIHWYRPDGVKDGMAYGNEPTVTAGQTYSVNFYYRAATPNCVGYTVQFQRWTNGDQDSVNFVLDETWKQFNYSWNPTQSGTTYFYWFNVNTPTRCSWDISEIMVYQGALPSEYITSSRSTSQTLYDLSKKGTIVANSLTYDYDNNRNFIFNGTSNYYTYTPNTPFDLYCLDFWMYNNNQVPNWDSAIGGPTSYQSPINFNSVATYGINLGGWTSAATNEAFHIWSATAGGLMTYNRDSASIGWHNVVFNWNGTTYDIWLDGVKTTTYAHSSGHAKLANITSLRIGADVTSGYYFNGQIPVVKCYNRQLSDDEVIKNFNSLKNRFLNKPLLYRTPTVDAYIIGGGGAGGGGYNDTTISGGGGGGGGEIEIVSGISLSPGVSYTVVVGAGGIPSSSAIRGGAGGNSSFAGYTANGGGGGASGRAYSGWSSANVTSGESAGGGSASSPSGTAVSPGNIGGNGGTYAYAQYRGGGGGGRGGPGSNGNSDGNTNQSGRGGLGYQLPDGNFYAAGGGGGYAPGNLSWLVDNSPGGLGGSSIGGTGGGRTTVNVAPTNGVDGTGSGGGGASLSNFTGGAGGSGAVMIRYPIDYRFPISVSGSYSYFVADGYRYFKWINGTGSVIF